MSKFNFNSQVCTSIDQSRRLLELGLKKETADCMHNHCWTPEDGIVTDIPAWSLHRLMILAEMKGSAFSDLDAAYETTISVIAAKIRFGYFNKEYLV